MNTNDDLLTRSLAALAADTTEDPEVDRHLAEFHTAYAQLDDDPTTVRQLDALVAEADHELLEPGNDALTRQGTDRHTELHEDIMQLQREIHDELHTLRTRVERQPKRTLNWAPLTASLMPVATLLMIVASVLLGIFAPFPQNQTLVPTTIFAATSAAIVLTRSSLQAFLAKRSTRDETHRTYEVLRLLSGGLSVDLREIELRENMHLREIEFREKLDLRQIEAREKVATSALRTASPNRPVAVQLHDNHLQLNQSASKIDERVDSPDFVEDE